MIQKVVVKKNMLTEDSCKEDLVYWLSRTPEERLDAVEILRRQFHGTGARLQRSVNITRKV